MIDFIFKYARFCTWIDRAVENMTIWIAWHLPKSLVKWCFVRVFAYASTGKFSNVVTGDITCIDALKEFGGNGN